MVKIRYIIDIHHVLKNSEALELAEASATKMLTDTYFTTQIINPVATDLYANRFWHYGDSDITNNAHENHKCIHTTTRNLNQ